ncbi:hypothetical protein WJX74_009679 [Apatococcus lobatus]|uniref:MaoC-like domain-containing protein n=1 Tax=Apatococcus lobatus TaxID=904363 RepID=A0AAW1SHA6_9CHLO
MLRLGPLLHCSCEASLASLQRMQRNHVSKPESAEQEPVEGCSDSSRLVWSDKRLFTAEIIQDFCRATGDFNPIHLDPDRAKRSGASRDPSNCDTGQNQPWFYEIHHLCQPRSTYHC